jgi:Family of unknown function (DUF6502)
VSDIRSALGVMCRRVLHPLVRILVRFGVSAGEFKAIVDSVYAHAGSEYLAQQGERVTYSKLAVITGINRAFLPAILANPQDEFHPRSNTQLHRAVRVLNGWYDDKLFQTPLGDPAVLSIDGEADSFRQLVELYSGGVYHQTMLSELERVGAVRLLSGDRVRAMRRTPVTGGANLESVLTIAETAEDLLNTLEHNLLSPAREQLPVRALIGTVDLRALPLFRTLVGKRADGLLEVMDQFMRSHGPEPVRSGEATRGVELGAAVIGIRRIAPQQAEAKISRPTMRRRDR